MIKRIILTFLGGFFHDLLTAEVGNTLLNGHVTVTDVQEHSVSTQVNVTDGYIYAVTVSRLPATVAQLGSQQTASGQGAQVDPRTQYNTAQA